MELKSDPSPHALRVKFWGVRGSLPTPGPSTVFYGGNTSCLEVRADGEIIVLDAGSGIRLLGEALEAEFKDRPLSLTILISHTHWDHIQGFPFFLPAYKPGNQVRILGYEGAKPSLATIIAGQMESVYFPIALNEMPGSIVIEELKEAEFSVGHVKCRGARMNHPGVTMGYRLSTEAGSIVYMPDCESFEREDCLHHPDLHGADSDPDARSRSLIEFIRGADALIIDSQYDKDEYAARAGWGHGCVDTVVELAMDANVKQMFLFHHDPGHDDARITAMVEHARAVAAAKGSAIRIDAAREGVEFTLPLPR